MFRLAQVDPTKLDLVKEAVTPGLEDIKRHNENADFTPEQVYQAIQAGRADLYAGYLDGEYCGFVITAERTSIFTGERRLLAWCGYAQRGFENRDLPQMAFDAVDDIARRRGIHKVFFTTSRPGWDRVAPRLGFHKFETAWVKEVQ